MSKTLKPTSNKEGVSKREVTPKQMMDVVDAIMDVVTEACKFDDRLSDDIRANSWKATCAYIEEDSERVERYYKRVVSAYKRFLAKYPETKRVDII
jgi:archaellum component FlaC